MLEHEAMPSKCLEICNKTVFALVNGKTCYCTNNNMSFESVKNSCAKPCPASYNYICGGDSEDLYSVYSTGKYVSKSINW